MIPGLTLRQVLEEILVGSCEGFENERYERLHMAGLVGYFGWLLLQEEVRVNPEPQGTLNRNGAREPRKAAVERQGSWRFQTR
jgi:hypothetical protein